MYLYVYEINDGQINQYRFGVMGYFHRNGQHGADENQIQSRKSELGQVINYTLKTYLGGEDLAEKPFIFLKNKRFCSALLVALVQNLMSLIQEYIYYSEYNECEVRLIAIKLMINHLVYAFDVYTKVRIVSYAILAEYYDNYKNYVLNVMFYSIFF